MDRYEPGDKVRTICEIPLSTPYSSVEGVRLFASGEALVKKSIPEGTPGVVVEHIVDLIVSFGEQRVVGRSIAPSMVERIKES